MAKKIEENIEEEKIHVYENWSQYELKEELERGIYACGFEIPSFIQKTAIMPILQMRDIRAQAQSGTGKTAAFGISALQRLSGETRTEVLILVTTREIADQNADRISSLAQFMNIKVSVIAGGTRVDKTIEELREGPEITVGTPGRVFHMIEQGFLDTTNIRLLIIDEADEMLNVGFKEQLKAIFEYIPETTQIAMFSATWEEEAITVAEQILNKPVVIDLRQDEQTLKGIDQFFVSLGNRPRTGADMIKLQAFFDIYQKNQLAQCVIFVNTINKAKFLHQEFTKKKIPCDVIHSELNQRERVDVLDKFRKGSGRLLIATGLIGRGIDIQQLSLVFNFDLPPTKDIASYIHRIGRAGRFGKKGKALNFIFNDEEEALQKIERHYKTSITALPFNFNLNQ